MRLRYIEFESEDLSTGQIQQSRWWINERGGQPPRKTIEEWIEVVLDGIYGGVDEGKKI